MNSTKVGCGWRNVKVSSFFVFVSIFFSVLFLAGVSPAFAQHDPIITIDPNLTNCDQLGKTFTVHVLNNHSSSDSIFEVRIYSGTLGITEFKCGPAPSGWTLSDYAGGDPNLPDYGYCEYKTQWDNSTTVILPGTNKDFTFAAVMWSEGCASEFLISTLDNKRPTGEHKYTWPKVRIDCSPPNITKIVGEPKILGTGFDWWVRQDTNIHLSASDNTHQCDIGLDYCRWRVTVDGGVPGQWNVVQNGLTLDWDLLLDDMDSSHYLEVECYDIAGNKKVLTETDKVDSTPPVTTKKFLGPQKLWKTEFGVVEWIDGVTTVELFPVDPENETTPAGVDCSIGVDKTLYINVLAKEYGDEAENACWYPDEKCRPVIREPCTECAMEAQVFCEQNMSYPKNSPKWVTCVENRIYEECMGEAYNGPMWRVYNGTPIEKDQESCHILQFYSIDELANKEGMNVNCFFVDKTPPLVDKDNGRAINDTGEDAFKTNDNPNGDFHWITSDMPITFNCTDQEPHPSGDEKLCYKVSYDYVEVEPGVYKWGYITDEYCDEPLTDDGYCCVPVDEVTKEYLFYFNEDEDSMHNLEYYCVDAVNKTSDVHIQYYKVDDTPPQLLDKWIEGPYYNVSGDCPPNDESDVCHLDGKSIIKIDVEDGGDVCAVGLKWCHWWYYLIEDGNKTRIPADSRVYDYNSTTGIQFPEESEHLLHIKCQDLLGNNFEDVERFFVDMTPPLTNKTYVGPQYPDPITGQTPNPYWITPETEVWLSATDDVGPHDSGVAATYYRDIYLPNPEDWHYCWEDCRMWESEPPVDPLSPGGDWMKWDGTPFYKEPESCHIIEYYSVDNVEKIEPIKHQCVFVDDTPPTGIKTVGEPRLTCEMDLDDEEQENDCVTTRTYTLDADFDEGTLVGLEHETVHDQLQLVLDEVTTYPVLWVANAGEDTLSKWDTKQNRELARYHTWFGPKGNHGAWSGPAPSRTAVDVDGNCYVANRQFPSNEPANVFKILTDSWIDRNSNGVLDTSYDANNDSQIDASEMLQFFDNNSNGVIDDNEITDERVAWVATVGPDDCTGRSLAIDLEGNIWLGCYNTKQYFKLDGMNGSLLAGPISVSPHTPYGALVDKYGILWGASLSNNMLRLNTSDNSFTVKSHSVQGSNYGIALGYDENDNTQVYLGSGSGRTYIQYNSSSDTFSTPAALSYYVRGLATDADGNIVAGSASGGPGAGGVAKFAPDGSLIWSTGSQVGNAEARGTVVDSDNNIWLVHVTADKLSKFDGTNGSALGWVPSGKSPYTYSDATGLGLRGSVSAGTWNVVFDTEAANSTFNTVSWNSHVPPDTSMGVTVRSSNDKVVWSPWQSATNGGALSIPDGRYMEVKVSMRSTGNVSPELYDLSVDASCGNATPDCWWVRDHVTEITLECEDQGDHPVGSETPCYRVSYDYVYNATTGQYDWGYITGQYCSEFGGTMDGDWCCADDEDPVPYVFNFTEDSIHNLEFYCVDHLGNKEKKTDLEYFKVDSVAPVTNKTYLGAYYLNPITGAQYIDTSSWIELVAEDGGPICAVGVNETQYRVSGPLADEVCEPENCTKWMDTERPNMGPWQTYNETFEIDEESCHVIEYRSVDHLGNTEDTHWQCVYVDKKAPVTTKTYEGPQYPDPITGDTENPYWITSETNVTLTVEDPAPHPSGVKETYFRDVYLEEEADWHYCYNNCSAWAEDPRYGLPTAPEPYNPAGYVYTGLEESCHILEYYSVDNVDKTENLSWQCVFVDNTPPEPIKTVGEPKEKWYGSDAKVYNISHLCWNGDPDTEIECWKVTLLTPITMQCVDPEPHPVDNETLCYKVDFDGGDKTEDYCEEELNNEGWCCGAPAGTPFYFEEECEHNLKYYCVDALGNKGPVDDEKFKVEGTAFEIELNKKWNLISVPFVMLEDSIDDVFEDVADTVDSVWTYDPEAPAGQEWLVYTPDNAAPDTLHEMTPGWGYWVYSSENSTLLIGGSLFSPAKTPPAKTIVDGWNLIGYFGTEGREGYYGPDPDEPYMYDGKSAYCELYSFGDDVWDKPFSSLLSYWEPYNGVPEYYPYYQWIPLNQEDQMNPGAGYWVYTKQEGEFVPPTTCGIFD